MEVSHRSADDRRRTAPLGVLLLFYAPLVDLRVAPLAEYGSWGSGSGWVMGPLEVSEAVVGEVIGEGEGQLGLRSVGRRPEDSEGRRIPALLRGGVRDRRAASVGGGGGGGGRGGREGEGVGFGRSPRRRRGLLHEMRRRRRRRRD